MNKVYKLFVRYSILLLFICTICHGYAQQGKNGAKTISNSNIVISNEYTYLTTNASAGNTSITVNNSALNTHARFTTSLSQGDLLMIIQMQGATIKGVPTNDSTWGSITNYNSCGLYEFSEVGSVPNLSSINLTCALKNNYTAAGNVQVVRVPRFTSLIINNGGVLTGDGWNGTTGGIIAVEVQNNTVINTGGSVRATGLGFRGGLVQNTNGGTDNINFASQNNSLGGAKGEGVAGYDTGYNVYGGMFGRGAPANGGGGGDQWNSSGGGGANAGNMMAYTGNGNPDTSNSSWITAWNLEYPGFANSSSSGGGRGGYTLEWQPIGTPSPLVFPPGNIVYGDTTSTDERNREEAGGKGGRPLDYSTGKIFAGGGGGAGHEDQGLGGSGGNGGGIVYVLSHGTVSGGGSIISNGQNGRPDSSLNNLGDGTGGAGAGGTVIIYSINTISGISITANGAAGGNQYINTSYECEGPGGGGGGGYIAISNGTINTQALGGDNGTTNSPLMTLFPPNGATIGGGGLPNQLINSVPFSSVIVSGNVSVCTGDSASLSAAGGTAYLWSPDTGLSCTNCPNPWAAPVQTTTYTVTVFNGSCQSDSVDSVIVTILPNKHAGTVTGNPDTICIGSSSQLTVTGSTGNIQWQSSINGVLFTNLSGDTSTAFNTNDLDQTTYYRIEASGTCGTDSSQVVAINVLSSPNNGHLTATPDSICAGGTFQLSLSGIRLPVQWQMSDSTGYFTNITGTDSSVYTTPPFSQPVNIRAIGTNGYCPDTSATIRLIVNPPPVPPVLSTADTLICFGDSTRINTNGEYSSYMWNNGYTTPYTFADYAGGYWVTVTDANGCTAVSNQLVIKVYPISSISILQIGDTLIALNGTSYQWFFNDTPIFGATNDYYTATQTGIYTLALNDTNGCITQSSDIPVTTGINELAVSSGLRIYPNPAFGEKIAIETGPDAIGCNLEIFDDEGRMVYRSKVNKQQQEIDISSFAKGIYILQVSDDYRKLIRQ